jgi:6-phosphogluconolactonase
LGNNITTRLGTRLTPACPHHYRDQVRTISRFEEDVRSLTEEPLQSIATAEKAHAIVADPSNRFVFVPHTAPNAIFQFNFQETTGRLTANAVPRLTAPPGSGPRHLVFHPQLPIAYVVNEQGGSVTAYRLDQSAGTLAPIQTIPTLPAGSVRPPERHSDWL